MSDADTTAQPYFWLSEPMPLPASHPAKDRGREFLINNLATDITRVIHVIREGTTEGADAWSIESAHDDDDDYDPETEPAYLTRALIELARMSLGPDPEPDEIIRRRLGLLETRLALANRQHGRETARNLVGWLLSRQRAQNGNDGPVS